MLSTHANGWLYVTLLLVVAGACSDERAVAVPAVDAAAVAKAMLAQCDTNGNGSLNRNELTPGLLEALGRFDKNGDKTITVEEIEARVDAWLASGAGMIPVRCSFTYRGNPIVGAKVEFTPEAYLSDAVLPAVGRTNRFGWANMSIPAELRPGNESRAGIQFGVYAVSVTAGDESDVEIPAKYSDNSELGVEISMDAPGVQAGLIHFDLE